MTAENNETRPLNIYQRLLKIMEEVSYVQKEDKRVNNQYTFVSHDAVSAKTRGFFIKRGVYVHPTTRTFETEGNRSTAILDVTFINVDAPEEKVCITMPGHGIDPQDKGPGKAVSYAFKYAILKSLMLETGDDPERDTIEYKSSDQELEKMIAEAGYDKKDVLKAFGVDSISELDAESRQRVINTVKKS